MRRAAKAQKSSDNEQIIWTRLQEGLMILIVTVGLFLLVSLASYQQEDTAWSHVGMQQQAANAAGKAGALMSDVFLYAFGYLAYLFPLLLFYSAWRYFCDRRSEQSSDYRLWVLRGVGFCFIIAAGCGLSSLAFDNAHAALPLGAGGIFGQLMGIDLAIGFNVLGSILVLLALLLIGVTLFTGLSWISLFDSCGYYILLGFKYCYEQMLELKAQLQAYRKRLAVRREIPKLQIPTQPKPRKLPRLKPSVTKPIVAEVAPQPVTASRKDIVHRHTGPYQMPPIELLDEAQKTRHRGFSRDVLETMSRHVEARLLDFNVQAQVVAVHPGPVITRFELQLAPGIKVSKVTALAKDLARSLSVISVRVVEVIPGKSVIGLELPNETREMVRFSEIIGSEQFEQAGSMISLALGKDIAGHAVIVDLAKMPHLLVAGTTGSGKSVGLNAMLLSLLYKATPEEVRLILIDPKMLELSVYDDIPHLLTPVVTDMKEAGSSLRWCVAEMERRYKLMAALGVRNLASYNAKVIQAKEEKKPLRDPLWPQDAIEEAPLLEQQALIVVVIDELADMMMVVGKKVEDLIARIAQKARAAGIHLILATQRPSVDVLTGLIKANVPTRIGFQVSSKIDSRTILDQPGAEQLLGYGDMLYLAPGTGVPTRVHGAFVDDHEVHRAVKHLRAQAAPSYLNEITQLSDNQALEALTNPEGEVEETDPLYDKAVKFVIDTRRASVSGVQRKFKIGYNRAARMIEQMEQAGLVSGMESNGNREILVPKHDEH